MKTALFIILLLLLSNNSLSFEGKLRENADWFKEQETSAKAVTSSEVKVYLIAIGDNGKNGKKIGCEDSLIAVTKTVNSTTPLEAAVKELLATPRQYDQQLSNYWSGEDLELDSVVINKGTAIIRISGNGLSVGGVCDVPRITSQIEETAKQFPNVKKVKVFVNERSLKRVLE